MSFLKLVGWVIAMAALGSASLVIATQVGPVRLFEDRSLVYALSVSFFGFVVFFFGPAVVIGSLALGVAAIVSRFTKRRRINLVWPVCVAGFVVLASWGMLIFALKF